MTTKIGGCEISNTINAFDIGDIRSTTLVVEVRDEERKLVVKEKIVRRLTPLEYERLQGFPDNWTNLGEWVDSKGKKHKDSDTPRYKALGNSIAIPCFYYVFQKMDEYLPKDATLGSLFAGIGGFDLAWETIHGKGTSRWSSEIEEFPIAVLKERFGDENAEAN